MLKIEILKGSPDWDELDITEKARIERLAELLDKNPDLDKRLLFVAVTRSRCNLFMSYSSAYPHPLIQNLPNITQIKYQPNQDDEDEEFF